MILVAGARRRVSWMVAKPSSTPSSSGGRPRSCSTTAGSCMRTAAMALLRSDLIITSYLSKCQRNWLCSPRSSSTIRSAGLWSDMKWRSIVGLLLGYGFGLRFDRNVDRKGGADAGFAFHGDVATEVADEFPRLINADAHALARFGGIERAEQAVFDKVSVHAGTIVFHFDEGIATVVAQCYVHVSVGCGGFLRVLDDVGDDHLKVIFIGHHFK